MARKAREKSLTGLYHVMVKGVGNQIIFEDDYDKEKFLELLIHYKMQLGIKVLTFCLMDNHVHLLLRDDNDKISLFMQKLEISYAYYFNIKYRRIGPLFNGRFQSEVVENDQYLITVVKYILKNPEKAGLGNYSDYKWSSYKIFISISKSDLIDKDELMKYFENQEDITEFLDKQDNEECLEIKERYFYGIDDEKAKRIIRKKLKLVSGVLIRSLNKEIRNKSIKILLEAGCSKRQIERLSGVSRGVISRIA